ncbi:biotin transporter BioY [Aquabacter sp. L1I39]|uniref:biotin transporter BioY n=1 Tax=Aquabacter sp. L1I39 TaxID=2820278 RepID=UPI001AD98000|nr:biotin transporter BioY [Aquabacter sp. L1I39]QTL05740.1 biotin transporter BioY [Aquabacter sp. L1I39]
MTLSLAVSPATLRSTARQGLALVAGVALLTLSAKIRIPVGPVPITLQTFAVLALAATLGPRLALATFVAYLGVGAAGLPVFAGTPERGIGLAYMVGPTGGYLAGFLVATLVTSLAAEGRGVVARTGAMLAGLGTIYGLGLAWLALYVPADKLLAFGFTPFIIGDLVEAALAAGLTLVVSREWMTRLLR